MINKILIRKSDRKTLHKDRRSLGMSGENLQEVLLFCLDEKIEGTGIVEVELPNGEKGMIEVERTEEGYELPVKSSLLTQTGFVKFQLRILHDNEEIFKSEIIPLEVKDSINATETIPEQYPTWIDTLTNLKQDLEQAEQERVSNENERISAEKKRQENFTKMQETVSSAVSNIKDLTEEYNSNAKKETKKFNDNAVDQTKTFNDNSDSKLAEYNKNNTDKIKEYDDNAKAKLDEYNKNDKTKTDAYNNNASNKEETFNTNAAAKQNEFDENASDKLAEYNQNAKELINKVEQVQAENETLKAENKLIKEQIPSASASGNSIHVEDSGTLDFDWKINGNQYQATREGYNLLDFNVTQNSKVTVNEDGTITINGTGGFSIKFKEFEYKKGVTYKAKATLVSGTYTSSDPNHIGIMTPYGDNEWLANNIFKTYTFLEDKVRSVMWVGENCVFNNATFEIYSYEGTDDKNFEQYGVSPSLDYPSEIETVKGSVEIEVCNKNLYNFKNKASVATEIITNEEGWITATFDNSSGSSNKYMNYITENLKLKNSTQYAIIVEIKKVSGTGSLIVHSSLGSTGQFKGNETYDFSQLSSNSKEVTLATTRSDLESINWGLRTYLQFKTGQSGSITFRISVVEDTTVTASNYIYIPHQSYTKVLPIQQEMLENDYVADVEHHEWQKFIFDGVTNRLNQKTGTSANNLYYTSYISNLLAPTSNGVKIEICSNCFKSYTANQLYGQDLVGVAVTTGKSFSIGFGLESSIDTLDKANEKLKELYDAGTPIIIYYKLAEAIDLELTEEQKAVRDTKLYTYKNITNIAVSDELASIDVNYKKDPTTEHDELQNQIDEIKQLISTTETSALLLDNLQKDVETEVE